ncbi:MAG: phosphotransferase family protein [Geminicoccaceae bacterium]
MGLNIVALAAWMAPALAAEAVAVERLERLGGGAIQENWALDAMVRGGPHAGTLRLVLRTSSPSGVAVSWGRAEEFAILRVAHGAGVLAPEPLALCTDEAVIGRTFYLMRRLPGEARGAKLVRDPAVLAQGEALVTEVGRQMARLHRVTPPVADLGFMPHPGPEPGLARVAEYRRHLDGMDAAEPVLEWALSWLARRAPPNPEVRLIHGDFRTGNFLVHEGRLGGVLDWEFAAFGSPEEDLGWMLARCWRFGAWAREAGGLGSRKALLEGYAAESGRPVDRDAVAWWEVMATVRWAVIALMQAERHYSGAEPSLEMALTAHLLPSLELDLLTRIAEIEAAG